MAPNGHEIGELPEDLAVAVLRHYGSDPLTDLPSLMRATEANMQQIAAVIVLDCVEGRWRGVVGFDTRARIVGLVESYFTPDENEPHDPLVESAQRQREFDPFERHQQLHDPQNVVTLGDDPIGIRDSREGRS